MISVLLLLIQMSFANATLNPLFVCLGKEEKNLHIKKAHGPILTLNQKMISLLLQLGAGVTFDQDLYKQSCESGVKSPSLFILEELVLRPEGAFRFSSELNEAQLALQEGLTQDVVAEMPKLFLNLVAQVQANAPTIHCLNRQIPGLRSLFEKIKYLEKEVTIKALLEQSKLVSAVFIQLHDLDNLYKKCAPGKPKALKKQ